MTLAPADAERHEALIAAVAERVAAFDGLPAGGAMIGPRILFLGAFGGMDDERLITLGTAVELMRRATLVHRRPDADAPSRDIPGLRLSRTLQGDTLLAASFQLLAADGDPRTVQVMAAAMAEVSRGELSRDGGGEAQRAAYAEGAAEVASTLMGLPFGDAAALRGLARAAGLAHERASGNLTPGDVFLLQGLFANREPLVRALEHRLGTPDTLNPPGLAP